MGFAGGSPPDVSLRCETRPSSIYGGESAPVLPQQALWSIAPLLHKLGRHASRARLAVEQELRIAERIRMEREALVLLQERRCPATWHEAFDFLFGTGREPAQPPEIAVIAVGKEKHIDLMVRDADLRPRMELRDGLISRPPQLAEPVHAGKPDCEVHILAFVQDFDAEPPVGLETRNLAKKRARDRAEQRNLLNFGETRELSGDRACGSAEIALSFELILVLPCDFTR
jgi:hypothetical protein